MEQGITNQTSRDYRVMVFAVQGATARTTIGTLETVPALFDGFRTPHSATITVQQTTGSNERLITGVK